MSKMTRYLAVIVLICLVGLFAECKKTASRGYVDMDTDSSVIKHFNFLPGSYWIYNDALSSRVDSFFVRSNEYVEQVETYNVYNYHIITIVQHNLDGSAPADSANWVFSYQGTRIMVDYDYGLNDYGWKNQIQFAPLFMYPFQLGDMMGRNDSSEVTKVDTVYSLNGITYRNVAQVYHQSDADTVSGVNNITKLKDWFFVNDSVGLIRMQLSHPNHNINHVWQLLRYHIEK